MGKQRHCCNSAMDDLLVTKQNKCNDLQGQVQGLGNKAKDLTFKAKNLTFNAKDLSSKAKDLTSKAKDLAFKAKDLKIVLKNSLRLRTPITDNIHKIMVQHGT